ncbi:MAG: hypothetical protein ABSB01_22470 [Streptosporangiaceae bacterium]|jgi:uncharacterized integral membrane protein
MRTGLIAGAAALIVVVIFIIQNARPLLLAAIAGALLTAAARAARITQLQRIMHRAGASHMPGNPPISVTHHRPAPAPHASR